MIMNQWTPKTEFTGHPRSTRSGRALAGLLILSLALHSAVALADRANEAAAHSSLSGTTLEEVNTTAVSTPLGPDEQPFPLNEEESPWETAHSTDNPVHGLWAYAEESGRVRTAANTGVVPGGQVGTAILKWQGSFIRDSSDNPSFTFNPSSLNVLAQGQGAGLLKDSRGQPIPPFAYWLIMISISYGFDPGVSGASGHTLVYLQTSKIRGIVDNPATPLTLENSDYYDPADPNVPGAPVADSLGATERVFVEICVPVPAPQCTDVEVGLEFTHPGLTKEIDLDMYDIGMGEAYKIFYSLTVEVGEDGAEQYAEALLGDPLDVGEGGLTLETNHTPVATSVRLCDVLPDPGRYRDHGDGTVTDTHTGLMWQRCPAGYTPDDSGTPGDLGDDVCLPSTNTAHDWQSALQLADGDAYAGYEDWLVPNVKQLESLVETGCLAPLIDTRPFPDTPQAPFWSSTPEAASARSWQVHFGSGDVSATPRDSESLVRLVRDSGETPLRPAPGLIAGRGEVVEGNAGTTVMQLPVQLTRAASGDVTVGYEIEALTASDVQDFVAVTGTLTIPAGETLGTIPVTVNGDTAAEGNEELRLRLANASAGVYVARSVSRGIILDDEAIVSVTAPLPEQPEGDAGTQSYDFEIRLDTPAVAPVNVDYATRDIGALAGSDYEAGSGTVTINTGEQVATVAVSISGDTLPENDETLELEISNVSGAARLGTEAAVLTIIDDDGPGSYLALNDTGVTYCATVDNTLLACPQAGFPLQDGEVGRDVTANDPDDGLEGFSFTKLDADGAPIANQAAAYYFEYYGFPINSNYAIWDCVQDEVTGLTWEVKTDVPGDLRHYDWTYSWYNSSGVNDGGDAGAANAGNCTSSASCDTEAYVAAVNAANLCGFNDWRVPRQEEIFTLAVTASPSADALRGLDSNYFPHNYATLGQVDRGFTYWSSTPDASDSGSAWALRFESPDPNQFSTDKSSALRLRLVRGGL
jgi:hypothetical protein